MAARSAHGLGAAGCPALWAGSPARPEARGWSSERAGGENSRVTQGSCPAGSPASPLPQEGASSRRRSPAFGAEPGGQASPENTAGNTDGGRPDARGEAGAAAPAVAAAQGWSRGPPPPRAGAGGRAERGTLRALTFAGCPPDWSPRRAAHGFIQLLSTSPSL